MSGHKDHQDAMSALKCVVYSILPAMLKTTFTLPDWLFVPTWLTVEELKWCHSVLASQLNEYVF